MKRHPLDFLGLLGFVTVFSLCFAYWWTNPRSGDAVAQTSRPIPTATRAQLLPPPPPPAATTAEMYPIACLIGEAFDRLGRGEDALRQLYGRDVALTVYRHRSDTDLWKEAEESLSKTDRVYVYRYTSGRMWARLYGDDAERLFMALPGNGDGDEALGLVQALLDLRRRAGTVYDSPAAFLKYPARASGFIPGETPAKASRLAEALSSQWSQKAADLRRVD